LRTYCIKVAWTVDITRALARAGVLQGDQIRQLGIDTDTPIAIKALP
jgi:hypothetical protein